MPKQESENDLCRCCHSEGGHKSLYEAHSWMDEEEVVYSKLLQDCFDIEMATVTQSLQHMLCTICDSCIKQLQDAVKFKRQVLKCEKRFRDVYGSCVGEETRFMITDVKVKREVDVDTEESSFNGASANTSAAADSSRRLDDDDDDDGLNDDDDFKPIDEDAVKVKKEVDKSDSEDDLCLTEVGKRKAKAKAKPGPAAKKAKPTPSSTENREDDDDEELAVIQDTFIKCSFSRLLIFKIWHEADGNGKEKHERVLESLKESFDTNNVDTSALDIRVFKLCKSLEFFWTIVRRTKSKLLAKYADWLSTVEFIELPKIATFIKKSDEKTVVLGTESSYHISMK